MAHNSPRPRRICCAVIAAVGLGCIGQAQAAAGVRAIADLQSCSGDTVSGTAVLTEAPSQEGIKQVSVSVQVFGLEPDTLHATHIHQTGACDPCSAANGHFDPGPNSLTNPDGNHPHHAGDLPNVRVDHDGVGTLDAVTSRVTLSAGPLSVFDADGSAVIIHVGEDSYCPEGPTPGCAGGARAACGVIRPIDRAEVN